MFKRKFEVSDSDIGLYYFVGLVAYLYSWLPFFFGTMILLSIGANSRKRMIFGGLALTLIMWASAVAMYYQTINLNQSTLFGHFYLADSFHFELYVVTVIVAPFIFIAGCLGRIGMTYSGDSKKAVAIVVVAAALIYVAKLPIEYTYFKGYQKDFTSIGERIMVDKANLLVQEFADRHPELDEAEVRKLQTDIFRSNMTTCKILDDKCPLTEKGL